MKPSTRPSQFPAYAVLLWGSIWGAFEATVGCLLHMLPISIGAYVWFPAAYFFMDCAYRATGQKRAVLLTALLSAAIKLINLLTPMRPDYAINPAVSIVLESLAMAFVLHSSRDRAPGRAALTAIVRVQTVNTLWRLMYALYLGFLVPGWMREISVIRDSSAFLTFLIRDSLISSGVCAALLMASRWARNALPSFSLPKNTAFRYVAVAILFVCGVTLQIVL